MVTDLIRQRKSVRTFDGKSLRAEDRSALEAYTSAHTNPFSVPITFRLLDVEEYGLSSPVIVGADTYLAAKVEKVPNYEIPMDTVLKKPVFMRCPVESGP